MNIIVCMKQVPSSNQVRLHPETNTIIRDGRAQVINPFDSHALEEAVRIRDQLGGKISVLSMGIPETARLLLDALARGADRALLLSDRAFAGADTLATSYTLSLGVRELGAFDLILCGKMAVDGDTAQIGPELAETLGIPHITDVRRILGIDAGQAVCVQQIDGGERELLAPLPALLTVTREINQPRLPSISGIRRSLDTGCRVLGAAELEADLARTGLNGSPTQVLRTFIPNSGHAARQVAGDPAQQAAELCRIIGEVLA